MLSWSWIRLLIWLRICGAVCLIWSLCYWLIICFLNLSLVWYRLWLRILCLRCLIAVIYRFIWLLFLWWRCTADNWIVENKWLRLPSFFNVWRNAIWTTWKGIRKNVNEILIKCPTHIETILLRWTCYLVWLNWELKCIYVHY